MLPPHLSHRAKPKAKVISPVLRLADVVAPGVPTLADQPLDRDLVSRPLPRAIKRELRVLRPKGVGHAVD